MESDTTLDDLDRRIVSALQIDGFAPVARIGEVLGVSGRTISRRLSRLTRSAGLLVTRVPARTSYPADASMVLRAKVLRGRIDSIADALARRPDVPFVDITLSGDEIVALAIADPHARDRLIYEQLPASSALVSTTALSVLHVFADAADWRAGYLTPDEIAGLTPPAATEPAAPDDADIHLLTELTRDARLGISVLATATGQSESTVRRRLHRLRAMGLLRTHVSIDSALLGYPVDAHIWMSVSPGRLHDTGLQLASDHRVHGVMATTGPTNLLATVFCRNLPGLYAFVTDTLGPLDIATVDTSVVGRAVQRAGYRGATIRSW
ncbi:Lrp/AsnC family transcriptional regulator [Nocardia sp. NPDC006630]|uniref:Lrp/AsnC family transcriptional regulator n=1 Tax=Nocardia sp. NPDC006630 TaxID=3157181 RepID=UPI0033A4E995